MTRTFFAAVYQDTFDSEASAIRGTRLNSKEFRESAIEIVGGGRLYSTLGATAFVITDIATGQVVLWSTSSEFRCSSHAEAMAAIEEFESVRGQGGWRVFECAALPPN